MYRDSISIVVPIIPRHHKYAESLVRNLLKSSTPPFEIIFAASSQNAASEMQLQKLVERYPLSVRILSSRSNFTAGENRNRGWDLASGDFVSFCDADDLYSKYRLEIISRVISNFSPDLILHNYTFQSPKFFINKYPKQIDLVHTNELYMATFGIERNIKDNIVGSIDHKYDTSGVSNINLPAGLRGRPRVHHGHVTIRSSVDVRFPDIPYAEDGIFCRIALSSGLEAVWLSAKLSNYERFNISNLSRNSLLYLKNKASKFKQELVP